MPAVISLPETKEMRLERTDERFGIPTEEKTTVTIRQAKVRENSKRSDMFATIKTQINPEDNTETRIFDLPFYGLIIEEIFLTLVGCNLTVGKEKAPLFTFANGPRGQFLDMDKTRFLEAIGVIDDEILAEIHEKVLEVNPHWRWVPTDTNLGEGS